MLVAARWLGARPAGRLRRVAPGTPPFAGVGHARCDTTPRASNTHNACRFSERRWGEETCRHVTARRPTAKPKSWHYTPISSRDAPRQPSAVHRETTCVNGCLPRFPIKLSICRFSSSDGEVGLRVAGLIGPPPIRAAEALAVGLVAAFVGSVLADRFRMRLFPHVRAQ